MSYIFEVSEVYDALYRQNETNASWQCGTILNHHLIGVTLKILKWKLDMQLICYKTGLNCLFKYRSNKYEVILKDNDLMYCRKKVTKVDINK